MHRNGKKRRRKPRPRREVAMEVRIIDDARHTPVRLRAEAVAWMRRWRRRPGRVFWEVELTGGQRLL